ncbi:aminotransferase class V [Emticicia oligotrophica DSM 17448]|uniref:cysteine desulfurase n=1 Tax=Emticicia oligotrophica (strain DSM 17448 / CIP 109782 / MTCC 6937 / GPTSA100-15) TaxID=929562 RepID=A0ABN4ANY6_EMTOG|nr:cysteine desulfurase family protein [Emticicia oligotrophica]AFK04132.1 aminotransferase class V [Emticicia oligotrophica DSM 17448]
MNTSELIYFDNNATTPLDERVLESMLPYFKNDFGNSSSSHHFGKRINNAVQKAREQISSLLNAEPKEIIFTSGATESINLGLKGCAIAYQSKGKHIITCKTEHKAVLDTCKYLEQIGFEVTYISVKNDGIIDIEEFKNALRKDTIIVSIMWVNNETGVIQPIEDIIELTHENDSIFFTDATQAVGKIPIDVYELDIDLLSFSAHKFYGPKGIGGLFIKRGIKVDTQLHGGGHEYGLRSGTSNVPAIIGIGKACEIALEEMKVNSEYVKYLQNELEDRLLQIKGTYSNGNKSNRIYNTLNICFPSFDANFFIDKYKNIAVSNGSACTAALVQPSHVLIEMGLSEEQALGSLRLSLSKKNTIEEVNELINIITTYLKR